MEKKFSVSVIGCNAEKFRDDYKQYIIEENDDYMDNVTFTLQAPLEVKSEIGSLIEEGIEII